LNRSRKRSPPAGTDPIPDDIFTQQLREMNDALLLSSIRQHELMEVSERANAVVSAANDRLEAIFETAPFGMYLLDEHLRFMQVSRKVPSVFGESGELIGRDFVEVVNVLWPSDTAHDMVFRFRHALATGEPYVSARFTAVRNDGARRLYTIEPAPLQEVDGWLDQFRSFWEHKLAALDTEIARGKRKRARKS